MSEPDLAKAVDKLKAPLDPTDGDLFLMSIDDQNGFALSSGAAPEASTRTPPHSADA